VANARFVAALLCCGLMLTEVWSEFAHFSAFSHNPLMVCHLTAGRKAWWESHDAKQGPDSAPGEL